MAKGIRELTTYLTEEQDEKVIQGVLEEVQALLTSEEVVEYIAVQSRIAGMKPDGVILTNRRFIIFRPKMIGGTTFEDDLWRNLQDAHLKEGMISSTLTFRLTAGNVYTIEKLPKKQARRAYAISQEREETALENRRNRAMEESRASAGHIVMGNQATPPPAPAQTPAATEDPVAKLGKLKTMLEQELITKEEFAEQKKRILESM